MRMIRARLQLEDINALDVTDCRIVADDCADMILTLRVETGGIGNVYPGSRM